MLTILIYAVCIALTATATTCILSEPGKPYWYVKKWLEDKYAYTAIIKDEAEAEQIGTQGKIDRSQPFTFKPSVTLTSPNKSTSFWIYEMLGACTICFAGQLAFWFCGIHKASSINHVCILLCIFALYLIATLTIKSKVVSALLFSANTAALWLIFGWKTVAQLPIIIGTTIFIAAFLEGVYSRQMVSR